MFHGVTFVVTWEDIDSNFVIPIPKRSHCTLLTPVISIFIYSTFTYCDLLSHFLLTHTISNKSLYKYKPSCVIPLSSSLCSHDFSLNILIEPRLITYLDNILVSLDNMVSLNTCLSIFFVSYNCSCDSRGYIHSTIHPCALSNWSNLLICVLFLNYHFFY